MAQPTIKISALTAATEVGPSDTMPIVQGGVTKKAPISLMLPPGIMMEYAGATAPAGYFLCNGQAVSRTTYSALFAAISTTWGIGNGTTTFNVPDMRESSPYGSGTYSAVTGTTHGAVAEHDAVALAAFADDRIESHGHGLGIRGGVNGNLALSNAGVNSLPDADSGGDLLGYSGGSTATNTTIVKAPSDDGSGAPRVGATTRGKIIGVNYIIKY